MFTAFTAWVHHIVWLIIFQYSLNRYVPIKTCLHTIPIGIELHGAEWPEEWPKRLESYPDWVNDKEKVVADTNHWNAVANKSYLNGLGINWTSIRNVMDMKSVYGGYARKPAWFCTKFESLRACIDIMDKFVASMSELHFFCLHYTYLMHMFMFIAWFPTHVRNNGKNKLTIFPWKCRLAVALSQQKVWVMNVVPVHAPDTLPIIFERGLIGIYHDWCESFGTYPRTYDLLHADHLFSRLKNRYGWIMSYIVLCMFFLLMFFHDIKWFGSCGL